MIVSVGIHSRWIYRHIVPFCSSFCSTSVDFLQASALERLYRIARPSAKSPYTAATLLTTHTVNICDIDTTCKKTIYVPLTICRIKSRSLNHFQGSASAQPPAWTLKKIVMTSHVKSTTRELSFSSARVRERYLPRLDSNDRHLLALTEPDQNQNDNAVYTNTYLASFEDLSYTKRTRAIGITRTSNASSKESRACGGLTLRRFDGTRATDRRGGACEEEQADCCCSSGGVD